MTNLLLFGVPTLLLIFISYIYFIRPWQLRWGSTDEEVIREMPGDSIVEHPTFNATRAITINAGPNDIWPWIMQIGINRAGWYSYDWIDNLGRPSSRKILPEFQERKIGDIIPFSPDGTQGLWVKDFQVNKWTLWTDQKEPLAPIGPVDQVGKKLETSWVWGLYPVDETHTRLITRIRLHYNWLSLGIFLNLALDVGDIIMMRKCMLGIKERAENLTKKTKGKDYEHH